MCVVFLGVLFILIFRSFFGVFSSIECAISVFKPTKTKQKCILMGSLSLCSIRTQIIPERYSQSGFVLLFTFFVYFFLCLFNDRYAFCCRIAVAIRFSHTKCLHSDPIYCSDGFCSLPFCSVL